MPSYSSIFNCSPGFVAGRSPTGISLDGMLCALADGLLADYEIFAPSVVSQIVVQPTQEIN